MTFCKMKTALKKAENRSVTSGLYVSSLVKVSQRNNYKSQFSISFPALKFHGVSRAGNIVVVLIMKHK